MFEILDLKLLLYVFLAAAVILGAVWYFVIAPFERRNHERKLAILQEKIRHRENQSGGSSNRPAPDEQAAEESRTE